MFLAPPGSCILFTVAGGLIAPNNGGALIWSLIGLLFATICALRLSMWLARPIPSAGKRFVCELMCFAGLMVVTCAVSFAGCDIAMTKFPSIYYPP